MLKSLAIGMASFIQLGSAWAIAPCQVQAKMDFSQPLPLTYGAECGVREVIDHLANAQPPEKGEFETSGEYQARLKQNRGKTGLGFDLADGFTLIFPIAASNLAYDADQQIFRLAGRTVLSAVSASGKYRRLPVRARQIRGSWTLKVAFHHRPSQPQYICLVTWQFS